MNRDDIIRMAREAGISKPWDQEPVKWETLERFAALVYAEAHKDGLDDFEAGVLPAAIKAEREVNAELVEALEKIEEIVSPYRDGVKFNYIADIAQAALAKAQGGKDERLGDERLDHGVVSGDCRLASRDDCRSRTQSSAG